MAKSKPLLSRRQFDKIASDHAIPSGLHDCLFMDLRNALDWYLYRRAAKINTPDRRQVRSSLEVLIVATKQVLSTIKPRSWMRPGLEGMANLDKRPDSRSGKEMCDEAIYLLTWVQGAASSWLDDISKIDHKYQPPSKVRGNVDAELVGHLLWLWEKVLKREVKFSDGSKLTKFILDCFAAAGVSKEPAAIRKQIERLPPARSSASRGPRAKR